MYIDDKKQCNYLFHFLLAQARIGEIADNIIVNFHKYNHISPEDMSVKIDEAISALMLLKIHYVEEYKLKTLDMEH